MKAKKTLKIIEQNLEVAIHDSDGDNPKYEQEQISALKLAVEALEKQIPKKPIGDLNSVPHYRCAACGSGVKTYENSTVYPYCHYCGQKLLWEE